jgi:hypothetical protein
MFLRNKIAILSITLMSLMTIPTLAENDNSPVTSRIENESFDVEVKTPEGWSETKDFTSVPETFTFDGQVFRSLQFKNGSELNGCVVYFADDDEDDDNNVDPVQFLARAQEIVFSGSTQLNFTVSKVTLDLSFAADTETEVAKLNVKGTLDGSIAYEAGDPTKVTISGTVQADSTKGNVAVASGTISAEGAMPLSGTTGVLLNDGYQVIVAMWGTNEDGQVKDTYRFLEAISVKKKAPVEIVVEVVAEPTTDAVASSEPVAETSDVIVTVSVVVTESVSETADVTEPVAISDAVVTESVAVAEVVQETPVVATEASA